MLSALGVEVLTSEFGDELLTEFDEFLVGVAIELFLVPEALFLIPVSLLLTLFAFLVEELLLIL